MRDIIQWYRNKGWYTAAGISGILTAGFMISAIFTDNYSHLGQMWSIGVPWGLCPGIAMSVATAKVNAEILNPKGMNLQCHRCFAHKIVCGVPRLGSASNTDQVCAVSALEAQSVIGMVEFEKKPPSESVFGTRERERAPANYGTVELTHSSKHDVAEDVVRSMYAHVGEGAKRSERIVACNMKIVYVPEEDLLDLAQVYNSRQMGELRARSKGEDGARRVLRFFYNNGSSLAASTD